MPQNVERIQKGFRILHPYLAGYIGQEMRKEYGDSWWQNVMSALDDQLRDLPSSGSYADLIDSLDIANCLRIFDRRWNEIFRKKLSLDYRTWAKELMGVRNKVAHIGGQDLDDDYTWRALDTMSRLCEAFDDDSAEEIRTLARELRYGSAQGSTTVTAANAESSAKPTSVGVMTHQNGLPSWRTIMEPHPDVAQGRYKNAEFAANLAQVAKGEGSFEYRDPVEFFARTYVTEGMKGLLVQALKRVSGADGEPVIQLKTAFGGGKTHSIHELWMNNDSSAMIMPGSLPLDVPNVRDELTRYLSEEWNSIVDTEVDGKKSIPYQKDKNISRYGSSMACRRLARTILLGSAPSDRTQAVRGIESARIRLGTIQPNENIAVFNDALNTLQGSLAYLYASSDHYWYDTRPTLRKTMEDRASQLSRADVEYEIECRLKEWRREAPFAGLHTCPSSSLDVPDEKAVRLVILSPDKTHKANAMKSEALMECESILNSRGTSPRIYRNMLVFLAPDSAGMDSLIMETRRWLAWKSIQNDRIELNLDAAQNKETESCLARSNETVKLRLMETYCWLISPYIDLEGDSHTICWEEENIRGGNDTPITKVRKKLEANDALITHWAPALLLMKLDDLLWRDSNEIQIKKLWEYFCTYCYLPRLSSYSVLEECIMSGVNSDEYFAYAEGTSNGRYLDLRYQTFLSRVDEYGYLVKIPAALKQIVADKSKEPSPTESGPQNSGFETGTPATPHSGEGSTTTTPDPSTGRPQNTHFYLSTPLTTTRINKDVNNLVQEIINYVAGVDGAEIEINLEVNAKLPNGTPVPIVRTVTENCRTLKVKDFGFSE